SGHCWTSSETTPRHDAWRCMTGNYIYDPCFSSPRTATLVLCPVEPWRNRGVKMRLTRALPGAMANHGSLTVRNQPWALELYDGRKCVLAGGASSILEGRRLNYFCQHGGSTGLWGFPDRGTQPWTIYSAPYTATLLSEHVPVRDAWM
ncbi:MAG: afsK7, partial [Mycobacterium sp.]|nr:afsK7 [Mycobacterium sp.]